MVSCPTPSTEVIPGPLLSGKLTPTERRIISESCDDPVAFTHYILGENVTVEDVLAGRYEEATYPWEKQREIMRSVRDYERVVVSSGHSTGKTHIIVRLMMWFLRSKPGSVVIVVSPKLEQIKSLVFVRYRQLHQENQFPGEAFNLTSRPDERFPKWEAQGFTSRSPEGLSGWHEADQLFIFEEASGIEDPLYEAVEGMMSTQGSHWLLIGNPIRARGKFAEAIQDPTGDWYHIPISCWDHPNVKLGRDVYRKAVTSRVAGQEAPPVGRKLQPLPYPGTGLAAHRRPRRAFPLGHCQPDPRRDRRVRRFRVVHGRLFDTPPMRACAVILVGGHLNCQRLLGEIFCSRVKYWSLRLHWLKLRGRVLVGGGSTVQGSGGLGGRHRADWWCGALVGTGRSPDTATTRAASWGNDSVGRPRRP